MKTVPEEHSEWKPDGGVFNRERRGNENHSYGKFTQEFDRKEKD